MSKDVTNVVAPVIEETPAAIKAAVAQEVNNNAKIQIIVVLEVPDYHFDDSAKFLREKIDEAAEGLMGATLSLDIKTIN
jgi:flavin reductase (DIM6/NTAB) family NADH-FMN oxidoreductase RutF